MYLRRHVLFAEAGDGGGAGGGGTDASGAGGAGAGAQGQGAGGEGTGSGAGGAADNVLAHGKEGAIEALSIPDKYLVKKDGTEEVDNDATMQKLLQGHKSLEQRFGKGEAKPADVGDYKITVPDAFKDVVNPTEDKGLQTFLSKAHAADMTQAQIDLVMETYFDIAPALVTGAKLLSADECIADLKKNWASDQQFTDGIVQANRGLSAYAGKDADSLLTKYGNDPEFVRFCNAVGADVGEDTPPSDGGDGQGAGETVETLMASKAYKDPKDPQHADVSAKVRKYFEGQSKAAERAGRAALI